RAIELDPEFALAHAYLSIHHTLSYARHRDDSPERLERARRAAERALELDPELAEAHVA
ncbi:MAG: adenylate/guanylate cyclase domain-containing protein, partial [Gammaproteobacteria bacterium]|nr:adenylate/guanylate cyclase domain-containing protein [Gemmatimonadota bacterium]NIT88850.1 adenylate/guanylate cyclase domain-containing protein [Gemmatimonadota bacterium]NIU75694.1 adenylate/guanylate cyclase domain-containing protein [Gammaproteobacteria bacterium]NIX40621.1 adenylate/guanylate cyclase domain-containing protein [Gemmatimonadota bacterium]